MILRKQILPGIILLASMSYCKFDASATGAMSLSPLLYAVLCPDNVCITVSTLAGAGPLGSGFVDATGTAARFASPGAIAIDSAGNIYVGDQSNNSVRIIYPNQLVGTLAGSTIGTSGYTDATGTAARFWAPNVIGLDSERNVYVNDYNNKAIRKITQAGVVTTLATSAIYYRFGVIDATGNIYIGHNNDILKITPQAVTSRLAGPSDGSVGFTDGLPDTARFKGPIVMARDSAGSLFIADEKNNAIRLITFR